MALLSDRFAAAASDLGLDGNGALRYRPRSQAPDAAGLAAELAERVDSDLQRGFTTHGPHRDDLSLARDEHELRIYGPQGEQRLALLALLLAERDALHDERGAAPLLLLDDVISELDTDRHAHRSRGWAAPARPSSQRPDLAHVPGARGRRRHAVRRRGRRRPSKALAS